MSFLIKQWGDLTKSLARNKTDWSSAIRKSRSGVEGYDLPPLTKNLNDKVAKKISQ